MVKTVSGNSNNGFKFSDTMSGPSGNYGRAISARSGSKNNYNNKNIEEVDIEVYLENYGTNCQPSQTVPTGPTGPTEQMLQIL